MPDGTVVLKMLSPDPCLNSGSTRSSQKSLQLEG